MRIGAPSGKGPIVDLYRVIGYPSYFLVGKDGNFVVVARDGGRLELDAELTKLIGR